MNAKKTSAFATELYNTSNMDCDDMEYYGEMASMYSGTGFSALYDMDDMVMPRARSLSSYSEAERIEIYRKCALAGKEDPWSYTARKNQDRHTRAVVSKTKEERQEEAELPPVKKVSMEFKISLQQARMAAGLKQSDLAAKVKVTAKVVSDWEAGKSLPSGVQRGALNKALKAILPKA